MSPALGATDLARFRAAVGHKLGLHFEDGKLPFLAEVLQRRLEARGLGLEPYLAELAGQSSKEEVRALARELTVPETYFFRNIEQFRALAEVVLPDRLAKREDTKTLSILSAGCASGEEPYSVGIILQESMLRTWNAVITAVDVNPVMLERARRARYSIWALRETPPEVQQKWFRQDGRDVVLDEAARSLVRFEERNLIEEDPELWRPQSYDVVFCRNVIMYLNADAARRVVERIERCLAPGGYLFLGHAETLRGLSQGFHLRHTHGTFYYQRKERAGPLVESSVAARPANASALAMAVDDATGWVDAIRRASERIEALTRAAWASPPTTRSGPSWDLGTAFELMRRERFGDALESMQGLPPESESDPDVLLLKAALFAHGGHLSMAEETCRRLLDLDELNAGAHYLLALCREGVADRSAAAEHDQIAIYLDPTFAMPRLHLGLLFRKGGNYEAAARELGQALVLLQREEASRLALFGGGFGREALIALCRAEIQACGGQP